MLENRINSSLQACLGCYHQGAVKYPFTSPWLPVMYSAYPSRQYACSTTHNSSKKICRWSVGVLSAEFVLCRYTPAFSFQAWSYNSRKYSTRIISYRVTQSHSRCSVLSIVKFWAIYSKWCEWIISREIFCSFMDDPLVTRLALRCQVHSSLAGINS